MVSSPVKVSTLAAGLALVLATELAGSRITAWFDVPPLAAVGLIRMVQVAGIIGILMTREQGLGTIGWAPENWPRGLKTGALWSLAFAVAAGVGMAAVFLAGRNPMQMVRSPLPQAGWELVLFFLVGGFIAPVAEEILFRGVLYTFFRRWGIVCALAVSTAIFVMLHSSPGIPYTQIIGGLVFAIAYEITGNLTVPMTIHCSGNLAIFTLSLF